MAGKFQEYLRAGRVFYGSTAAAGVAFPITTGTAITFGVWASDPNIVVVPLKFNAGYTSGTIALGSIGFAAQNIGFTVGTAAPCTALTSGTSRNAKIGAGNAARATFVPATATLTAGNGAAVPVHYAGKCIESATAGLGIWSLDYEFDDICAVMPGNIMWVASSVAQTGLFSMSMHWAEIPVQEF